MQNINIPTTEKSQESTSVEHNQKQQAISPAKGIIIILVFTVLLVVIGQFIGAKFFWNNYSKETKIEHELKMNLESVKNDDNNPNNHINLGWTYLKMGKSEQAVGEFKKTLFLDPKNYGAHLNLGLSYIKLEQYDNAITALKDAIGISPETYQPHLNLALSYYHVGRYEDALKELDVAYKNNPGTLDTMYVRGLVFEKQNKLEAALDEYNTALSFNPKDQEIQATIARVKKALNK